MTREEESHINSNIDEFMVIENQSIKNIKVIEYINFLRQQNTALQSRIKELEEPKTCDGCEHLFTHTNQCMNDMGCERILSLGIYADYFKPKQNQ